MMYVKVENGQVVAFPHGPSQLMDENPQTSFPFPMPEERLAEYGVFPVMPCAVPQPFDDVTQNAIRIDPTFVDGQWLETWSITPASESEITQRLGDLAQNARATRDQLLTQSDWTQLPDAPVDKAAWAAYRQKLRDISGQPIFPRNIVWPTV